jgi:lipoprotein-anchoring transpeptidase ErfK/SrfK
MKPMFVALVAALAFWAAPVSAASIVATIDISSQTLRVFVDGSPRYTWRVSTARAGYRTPTGSFRAQRMEAMWYSRKYDMSPMPHSVFFYGGFAIHGTEYIRRLGTPASHGCVRLHPANATLFYNLVRSYGMANTQIVVTQ